jgi:hypothetical protein
MDDGRTAEATREVLMALTLQRKLELAGDLSKVQPLLQRLHLVEKPKKRHRVRNVMLAIGAIGAGAVVAVVASRRRRGCHNDAVAGSGGPAQAKAAADIPATAFD